MDKLTKTADKYLMPHSIRVLIRGKYDIKKKASLSF